MYSKPKTDSVNQIIEDELTHTHVFRSGRRIYYIISKEHKLSWVEFLECGMICPGIIRFMEVSRDEFGIERVIRDVWR